MGQQGSATANLSLRNMSFPQVLALLMVLSLFFVSVGYAASQGADIAVTLDLDNRVTDVENDVTSLEGTLKVTWNPTFYTLQKPVSYIVSHLEIFYILQNGTTGKIDMTSTLASSIIQAAVGNLTRGGRVVLKDSQSAVDYTLAKQINITNSRVILEGESQSVTLGLASTFAADMAVIKIGESASYCSIHDLTLNVSRKADMGIRVYGSANWIFNVVINFPAENGISQDYTSAKTGNRYEWIRVESAGKFGIYLGRYQTDNWVQETILKNSYYNGTVAGLGVDASGNQIIGNHIWGNNVGILLAPNYTITSCQFISNYVESNRYYNMKITGHGVYDSTFSGNTFYTNGVAAVVTASDIFEDLADPYYCSRNVFVGNTFQGSSKVNIAINGTDFRFRKNSIYSNSFNGYLNMSYVVLTDSYGPDWNEIDGNIGFKTFDMGESSQISGGWVAHDLGVEPVTVQVTLEQTMESNHVVIIAVTDKNSTHFKVSIKYADDHRWTAGFSNVASGGTVTHGLGATPDAIVITQESTQFHNVNYNVAVTAKSSTTFTVGVRWVNGTTISEATGIYWQAIDETYDQDVLNSAVYFTWIARR